jgi:hypothetical protein
MKPAMKLCAALLFAASSHAAAAETTELKIDPLLLVSLNECRNIARQLGPALFPGWQFAKTPVLFYRPNVQEVLVNFPHQPKGFLRYHGFNPLHDSTVYVRNGATLFSIDDQNTSSEIDGIPVLVVADRASRARNQLRAVVSQRPLPWVNDWLDHWNFMISPYDELQVILHESFHVYQAHRAPDKHADEGAVARYPLLDPVNNALYVLEGNLVRDALLAPKRAQRLQKIREFVAVRTFRQSRLDPAAAGYENLNEYSEGLAKYVEYKFLRLGERILPTREMSYEEGFHGYRGVLPKIFRDTAEDLTKIIGGTDDRFGNRFGSGPLRFRLYGLGASEALMLDDVMPSWKIRIFDNGVSLTGLLQQAVPLSSAESARLLEQAKDEYRYGSVYEDKIRFETEGNERIRQQVAAILQTDKVLVTIAYGAAAQKLMMSYTPFGVTQVTKTSAIYDLTPIEIGFKDGVSLQMKRVVPLLIDRDKKTVAFVVDTLPSVTGDKVETDDFILRAAGMESQIEGRHLDIRLK